MTLSHRCNTLIQTHPYRFMALLALVFMLPAFIFGPLGSDLLFNTVWSQEFSHEFWRGNLYPRWLSRMNSGCGDPAFFYYYPLSFYLSALLSFTDTGNGWYPLCLAATASIFLMGVTCRLWLASLVDNKQAVMCATAFYMMSPSILSIAYGSFGYTNIVTFIWPPLMLYYARLLAQGRSGATAGYALALGGLYLNSITGLIVVAWLPVVYAVFCARRGFSTSFFLRLVAAQILGTLLAATYLLPMLELLPQVSTLDTLTAGRLDYKNNFLFSPSTWSANVRGSFARSSMVHLYCVLLAGWFCYRLRRTNAKMESAFWLSIACLIFFLMTPLSRFIWDALTILHYLQFSYRFGDLIMPLFMAFFLVQYFSSGTPDKHRTSFNWLLGVMVAVCTLSLSISGHIDLAKPPASVQKDADSRDIVAYSLYHSYRYYSFRRVVDDQYMPAVVPAEWRGEKHADKLDAVCKRRTHVTSGNATVTVKDWRARHILLEVDAATQSTLTVSQFSFPGWVARQADNPAITYTLTPSSDAGILEFTTPPGKHNILLELETLPSERYGTFISFITLCILLGMVVYSRQQR